MEHNSIMLKNKWKGNPHTFLAFRNAAHLKFQHVLAKKKKKDICKFQVFKKITVFLSILNIRGLFLECIRHFQRATSNCYKAELYGHIRTNRGLTEINRTN